MGEFLGFGMGGLLLTKTGTDDGNRHIPFIYDVGGAMNVNERSMMGKQ